MKKSFCIYCSKEVDTSKGAGDHIIPAVLGEFNNAAAFRKICGECNNELGKSEEEMLRCSPIRLFRDLVVPSTSRSRGKKPAWSGARGLPPPEIVVKTDYGKVLAYPIEDFLTLTNPDQLIIEDNKGELCPILLYPKMSAESLKKKVRSVVTEIDKNTPTQILCRVPNTEHYTKIIKEVWPNTKIELVSTEEAGYHERKAEISTFATDRYFRAIAKIAFHYYLTCSLRARGNEDGFALLREFILHGGDEKPFFENCDSFLMDDTYGMAPSWWSHILGATEKDQNVVGYVRLFRGPRFSGMEHHVTLGTIRSPIIMPREVWGHIYQYDRPVPNKGRVGTVYPLHITPVRIR